MRIGPLVIQGVIPRRRQDLAEAVGQVVATELLPQEQVAAALSAPGIRQNIATMAGEAMAKRIAAYPLLRPLPQIFREQLGQWTARAVKREVSALIAAEGMELADKVLSKVDLAELVRAELEAMDWNYMEKIVYSVAGKELKLIEVMGGVLGGLVGLIQAVVVYFAG